MEIGIKEAKNSLSKLISEAQSGNRVFLTNRGKRIIELVAVKPQSETIPNRGLGMYAHLQAPPAFTTPKEKKKATEAVLRSMGLDD